MLQNNKQSGFGESPLTPSIAQTKSNQSQTLTPKEGFVNRHIGPTPAEVQLMLDVLGFPTLDGLIDKTVPAAIRMK